MIVTMDIMKRLFAMLTCMALIVWSVMPSFSHAPTVFETIQDHLELVESHGHSHGFAEDIYWAMHGHSHDMADHDHNQAYISKLPRTEPVATVSPLWLQIATSGGPTRHFRIDRPPRV